MANPLKQSDVAPSPSVTTTVRCYIFGLYLNRKAYGIVHAISMDFLKMFQSMPLWCDFSRNAQFQTILDRKIGEKISRASLGIARLDSSKDSVAF